MPGLQPTLPIALVLALVNAGQAEARGPAVLPSAGQMTRGYGGGAPAGTTPADYGQRDAAGNLVIVNSGADRLPGGSGYPAWSAPGQTAVAIGNQVTVTVEGSWNTVIVDAVQTNTGDINANAGAARPASPGARP